MGPNGSGKSTLSSVLAGNDNYEVTNGSINFLGEEISEMSPEEKILERNVFSISVSVEILALAILIF